jgi:hypothetical protein
LSGLKYREALLIYKLNYINMKPIILLSPQYTVHSHKLSVKLIVLLFAMNYSLVSFDCFSQTAINTTGANPNNSAMLDVSSSNQGVLINRMNTTQMNNIASPAEGLLIFNVETGCFEAYVNGAWNNLSCPTPCTAPPPPIATTASGISTTSFVANWIASPGATAYYLDVSTVNTFASFLPGYHNLNIGNATSFTVGGLTVNTSYYYQVRAGTGLGCFSGNSNYITVFVASWSCGSPLTVAHTAGSVAPITTTISYATVSTPITGATECWITQNLGASSQATAPLDASYAARGWFWSYDNERGYDYNTSCTPTFANVNGTDGSWIAAHDPCNLLLNVNGQTGWRMPTLEETYQARLNAPFSSIYSAYLSVLKIGGVGYLNYPDGSLTGSGTGGIYATSTGTGSADYVLFLFSSYLHSVIYANTYAFPVRCVKP